MTHTRWPAAVAGLLLGTAALQAQVFVAPAGGVHFSLTKRSLSLSGSFGFGGTGFYAPYYPATMHVLYPRPYPPPRVTVIAYTPPPVFVAPPLGLGDLAGLGRALQLEREEARMREQLPPPEPPLPGVPAGGFRPILPEDRARARQPVRPEPAKPEAPKPKPPEPPPAVDPKAERARQVALGRAAFAEEAYGLAAERFRRAAVLVPDNPAPHFLLAQVLFALGKYHDAVEAVHAGLRLQPDWPAAGFRPLELYGDSATAFPEHLRRLEQVVDRHPHDPVVLFLYAYQLWFDGRRDEAVPLFRRAVPLAADPLFPELFLRAVPPGPMF